MLKVRISFIGELRFSNKNMNEDFKDQLHSIFKKYVYQFFEFPCVPMKDMIVDLESFRSDLDSKELDCLAMLGPFVIFETIIYSDHVKIVLEPDFGE